jgi:hypothetical protein
VIEEGFSGFKHSSLGSFKQKLKRFSMFPLDVTVLNPHQLEELNEAAH